MRKPVSVDKAIGRLQLVLANYFISMSVVMGIALYSLQFQQYQFGLFLSLFLSSAVIPTILTAFFLNRWKYWAFENVRNVHELKRRAILTNLIWESDSFFTKIENSNETDKKHWELKEKFLEADIFIDDNTVPAETKIYFSRALIFFYMSISIIVPTGLTFILLDNEILSLIVAIITFVVFLRLKLDKLKRKTPIIVINNKGIETINSEFISWDNIKKEDIISSGSGRNTKQFLIYKGPKGIERICISGLNIGKNKMGKLLILYRNRHMIK